MQVLFLAFLVVSVLAQGEPNPPTWPSNVYVFDPSASGSNQQVIDRVFGENGGHNPPFHGQWSNSRYALLFKPGNHNVNVNVGFYTSVIGLGKSPADTNIQQVRCENGDFDYTGGALDNFWRSAENFQTGATLWAVSQAAPLRRINVRGDLTLFQYNGGCCAGYASGGYLADANVTGAVVSGSQQQWFTRNSQLVGGWNGGVWNMVFVGNSGKATPDHCGNAGGAPWTTVRATPVIGEKPYISINPDGKYVLRVPRVERNKVGPTTNFDNADVIDFSSVFVATERNTAQDINAKLAQGLHVVLSPGNYELSQALTVTKANTVILGIGFPTLTATNGNPVISVGDVDGVRVAGILFQAGRSLSQTLISWGTTKGFGNPNNPGFMYDVFGRIGGTNNPAQYQVSANVLITVNHNYVVVDNTWLWRADHDITGNVKGGQNPSKNGLVVNGDSVITYGLAVEHHLEDGVVWNGENGRTYFYQCELPYDVTQAQFGAPGYAGYRVSPNVKTHAAFGVGVYSFFRDFAVTTPASFVAPEGGNIQFVHPFSRFLSGLGGIGHIVNNRGAAVNSGNNLAYICP